MNKFAPSKRELRFRLYVSIAGLSLLAGALMFRGIPRGPAMFEVIGIAGAFFGGTLIWTARKLIRKEYSDPS